MEFVLLLRFGMFALAGSFDNIGLTILSQREKYISTWQSTLHRFQNVTNITDVSVQKLAGWGLNIWEEKHVCQKEAMFGKICTTNATILH